MQHGDVENRIYPAHKQWLSFWRSHFFAIVAAAGFLLLSGLAYAADVPAGATPTTSCPSICTGTAAEIAHCQTTSGTGACASGGACTAQHCAAGCVGSFFVALGAAESGNSYSNYGACMGQWQFCAHSDVTRYCADDAAFKQNAGYCQDQDEIAYQQGHYAALKGAFGAPVNGIFTVNGKAYTVAGLLGAAQLCGVGGAISWVKSGSNPADPGGTTCTQYYKNFANTTLPPQFADSTAYASNTTGSCTQTAGQGGANPSTAATTPTSAPVSAPVSTGSSSPSSASSDPMSQMMPMMMMSMMMPMMSQMMQQMMQGGAGSGGSSGGSPLTSALQSLLNGSTANSPSSSSGSGTQSTSAVLQQLQQLEEQQQAAQQQAATETPDSPTSAVTSQPAGKKSGDGRKDYRISCASMADNPSVERCRSFVPQ